MFAFGKINQKTFQCDAYSQCRIEEGSTNPYLQEPRAIEDFLKDVEPRYNDALDKLRTMSLDAAAIYAIAGFAAYVETCSPAGMRIYSAPIRNVIEVTAELLERSGMIPPAPPEFGGGSLADNIKLGLVQVAIDPKYPQSIGIRTVLGRLSIWGNSWWDILINDDHDSPFLSSDHPVGIENSDRPGVVNRIVPLAPNLAIRIKPDVRQRDAIDLTFSNLRVRRLILTKQMVADINRAIVQAAEETVYSSVDRPWIPRFIQKYADCQVEAKTMKSAWGESLVPSATLVVAKRPKPC